MNNDRELMQQALEALELLARYENPATKIQVRKPKDGGPIVTMYPHKVAKEAAAPLRERLAQPERELVCVCGAIWEGQELVSTPPQRKPLTDEEILTYRHMIDWTAEWSYINFARAIEAAHGIKENT